MAGVGNWVHFPAMWRVGSARAAMQQRPASMKRYITLVSLFSFSVSVVPIVDVSLTQARGGLGLVPSRPIFQLKLMPL
jgi:hypothetical protein